jgi:hypothetical protein
MKPYVLLLTVLLMPGAVHAQEPGPAWQGIDRSALSTVFVLDEAGVETQGQLVRLDPDAIVVLVDGSERRFDTRRVARVTRRGDSLKNGALTGLVIGLVQAVALVAIQDCRGSCDARAMGALLAANTVSYVAMGTAIDAAIRGRTMLYQAPTPKPAVQSRGGAALSVRFTW